MAVNAWDAMPCLAVACPCWWRYRYHEYHAGVGHHAREIGIRMATERRRDILTQFLAGAVALSCTRKHGLALGAGPHLITKFTEWPTISPACRSGGLCIQRFRRGLFFVSAYKASELDPIDALRFSIPNVFSGFTPPKTCTIVLKK
jgi:hypothetical protein